MNSCIRRSYTKTSFYTNCGQRYGNVITSVDKATKVVGSKGSIIIIFLFKREGESVHKSAEGRGTGRGRNSLKQTSH